MIEPEPPSASRRGRVVWITGLPCSGKSSLAHALAPLLRAQDPRCVVLDGDELRPAIASDLGYALDERRRCAWRYARLATLLADQGMSVLVATISPFEEIRSWTRSAAPDYFEVFLRTSRDIRLARDRAGLYRRRDVIGADLPFEPPHSADLVIDDGGTLAPHEIASRVMCALVRRGTPLAQDGAA